MDYEKKYNEAMLRADEAVQKGCLNKDVFDIIFPPEESEDERIRKIITGSVFYQYGAGVEYKDVLDYLDKLEKQKELFESGKGMYYYDGEKTTYCGYPATEENPYDFAMNQQEKQKEQKPVEIHNPTDEEIESWRKELTEFKKFATKQAKENQLHISYTRDVMWENFCSELLSFVNSRKPVEWSEEDERMRNQLIYDVEQRKGKCLISAKQNKATKAICDGIEKCQDEKIAWLKSLRPQPNPIVAVDAEQLLKILPKKQEWSEEDEKMLSDLRNTLGCLMNAGAITFKTKKKFSNWLKSLRPSWKPSEKQMEALDKAIPVCMGVVGRDAVAPLESLYEQLKML